MRIARLGLQVYSRVDVLLPENAEPSVLEVNTIPGMTEASLLPEAAAAAGISYRRLCLRIIELVARAAGGREMKSSSSTRKRPRNQRVSNPRQRKQQHLLDVKVRARKATQYRNRRVLVFISKIALAAAICAGIYFGARVGDAPVLFRKSGLPPEP